MLLDKLRDQLRNALLKGHIDIEITGFYYMWLLIFIKTIWNVLMLNQSCLKSFWNSNKRLLRLRQALLKKTRLSCFFERIWGVFVFAFSVNDKPRADFILAFQSLYLHNLYLIQKRICSCPFKLTIKNKTKDKLNDRRIIAVFSTKWNKEERRIDLV